MRGILLNNIVKLYNGIRYYDRSNELECKPGPTNVKCGVVEYNDEDDADEDKRRPKCTVKPTKKQIDYLYNKRGLSLRGMETVSVKYFGQQISEHYFSKLMREYGIKARPCKGGIQQTKGQEQIRELILG